MNAIALALGIVLLAFGMALGLGLPLDYWHAWALFVLCSVLFKGSSSSSSKD